MKWPTIDILSKIPLLEDVRLMLFDHAKSKILELRQNDVFVTPMDAILHQNIGFNFESVLGLMYITGPKIILPNLGNFLKKSYGNVGNSN